MNDLVDRLAVAAATSQRGERGDRPPSRLGPPDSFGTGESALGIVEMDDIDDGIGPDGADDPPEPSGQGSLF